MLAIHHDLLSVGRLSELLQVSPAEVERAAHDAGVSAALRLDGRPYFPDESVNRLRQIIKQTEPYA